MIFIKQHNALFNSPMVEEPEVTDYWIKDPSFTIFDHLEFDKALAAYNKWLSSKIEVIGDHTWQDDQEVRERVDYEIEDQFESFGLWHNIEPGIPIKVDSKRRTIAIPITPKPDDLVPGVREDDSLASDKATSTVPCVTPLYDNNTTQE